MYTDEEFLAIDKIMETVEEGLREIETHGEYSTLQAAAAGGSKITNLPTNFRINSEVTAALRVRLAEEQQKAGDPDAPLFDVLTVFEGIKHGTEKHRAWLYDALTALSRGETPPEADAPTAQSTPQQLMALLGITEEERVVGLIDAYFTAFPGAKAYFVAAKSDTEGGK